MSVNSKMTAIANAVRDLRGMSGTMGLDAMATNINGAKTAVDAALAALAEKGVTVPDGTKVDGLADLIAAIEAGGGGGGGLEIQSGTITFTGTPSRTTETLIIDGQSPPKLAVLVMAGINQGTYYTKLLCGNINGIGFVVYTSAFASGKWNVETQNCDITASEGIGAFASKTRTGNEVQVSFGGSTSLSSNVSKNTEYLWFVGVDA